MKPLAPVVSVADAIRIFCGGRQRFHLRGVQMARSQIGFKRSRRGLDPHCIGDEVRSLGGDGEFDKRVVDFRAGSPCDVLRVCRVAAPRQHDAIGKYGWFVLFGSINFGGRFGVIFVGEREAC